MNSKRTHSPKPPEDKDHLQIEQTSKKTKPSDQNPTEPDKMRRTFLKNILAAGALTALPATLQACDFYYLNQNFDLSDVQPLTDKGPDVEIENLTEEQQYAIMDREWKKRNLLLDPKKLIQLPQAAGQDWEWLGNETAIKTMATQAGYKVINTATLNDKMSLSLKDNTGKWIAIYNLPDIPDNKSELVVMTQDGNDKNTYDEFHSVLESAENSPMMNMYEYLGNNTDSVQEIGFPDITAVAEQNPGIPVVTELSDGSQVSIYSKDEFWSILTTCTKAEDFLTLLLKAPTDFLHPADQDDLVQMIKTLPSNDPLYFACMIKKLVAYQKDSNMSQEFKAPMQSINDGWGDCDDYTMLNGYWGKLNGFQGTIYRWSDSISGEVPHVNVILTNPATGERFFCDNTNVHRGNNVDEMLDFYRSQYNDCDTKDL